MAQSRHTISPVFTVLLVFLTVSIPIVDCVRYVTDDIAMVDAAENGETEKEKEIKDSEIEDSKICLLSTCSSDADEQSLREHSRLTALDDVQKEVFDPPPELI